MIVTSSKWPLEACNSSIQRWVLMANELIRDGGFSKGNTYWKKSTWYSGNIIEFLSSGGQAGECVKLTVPSVGDPGQSSIYQHIPLVSGTSYTLTFYAKRTGNVDVWAEVSVGGSTVYSESFIPQLTDGGNYVMLTFSFTVPGTAGSIARAMLRLIAGSAGGTAWFDSASISGEKVYLSNKYVETDSNVPIYRTSTGETTYSRFPENARFVYAGIENTRVKIRFGNASGSFMFAYIKKAHCWSSEIELANRGEERMTIIAKSLVGLYGDDLGLGGQYCESFIHWLKGASGIEESNLFCSSNLCGQAVQYYETNNLYRVRSGSTPLFMQRGHLAYYDVSNYDPSNPANITAAHVGFVVDTEGDNYYAVEGNSVGALNANNQQKIGFIIGNRLTGQVDQHNRTMHGVAHPYGLG